MYKKSLRRRRLDCFVKCCLVLVKLVQFNFVDEWRVAGDAARTLWTEGQLIGEVEAVEASGVHQLEGFDESREHGIAHHVDY